MIKMKFQPLLTVFLLAASFLLPHSSRADDKVKMGFIYVGPKDDYGYNQSHAEGCAAVRSLPWVDASEEASVPETTAVEETMRDMIEQDGATVLFPTSFGYFNPYILKLAKEYPNVQFFHCGGLWHEGLPNNVGSYFGYIDEAEYVSGIVAAETSKTKKIGFIAAKPIPRCCAISIVTRSGRKASSPPPPCRWSSPAIGRCPSRKRKPPIALSTRDAMS